MDEHHRSIKNIFVQPKFLLKLSLYYMATGGLTVITVGTAILYKLDGVRELMASTSRMDFQTQTLINNLTLECVELSMFGFGLYIAFSFLFALIVSHRISGPQVAIGAYIEQLKQGNYEYSRNLRERDELTELMDALKELTVVLKEREKLLKG